MYLDIFHLQIYKLLAETLLLSNLAKGFCISKIIKCTEKDG